MLRKTSIHSISRPFPYESGLGQMRGTRQKDELNDALSALVEKIYGLYQECQYYYWIVAGDEHIGLDALFDKQSDSLRAMGAALSQRISDIGFQTAAQSDHLYLPNFPENRLAVTSLHSMLSNTAKGHEACSAQTLSALEIAEALKDKKTAALLTQAMLMHDKSAWMMRAFYS